MDNKDMGGSATETYYAYNDANALTLSHELPADTFTYFQYDRNGRLAAREAPAGTTYFAYAQNGLTSSIVPPTGDAVYFFYDGRMTRYAMKQGADITYFVHDRTALRILEVRKGAETRRLTHSLEFALAGRCASARLDIRPRRWYEWPRIASHSTEGAGGWASRTTRDANFGA